MTHISDIQLLAMDVDGVLTDGGLIYHPDGSESKRFHVHDGGWIRIWKRLGFQTAIITGRECPAVASRMIDLEIDYYYQKAWDKKAVFAQLVEASGVPAEYIAFIGDDVFDLPVLRRVGFAAAVADAIPELKQQVDFVTSVPGGSGAVAELIRYMLRQKGLWDKAMERYLR